MSAALAVDPQLMEDKSMSSNLEKIQRGLAARKRDSTFVPIISHQAFSQRHGDAMKAFARAQEEVGRVQSRLDAEFRQIDEDHDRLTIAETRDNGIVVRVGPEERKAFKSRFDRIKADRRKKVTKDALAQIETTRADLKAAVQEANESSLTDPHVMATRYALAEPKVAQHLAALAHFGGASLQTAAREAVSGDGNKALGAAVILANDSKKSADRPFNSAELGSVVFKEELDGATRQIHELEDAVSRLNGLENELRGGSGSLEKVKRGLNPVELEPADAE